MAIIEIAWRGIGRKFTKIIAIIILNAIAIVLIGGIMLNHDSIYEDRFYCEKVFKKGIEDIYVISVLSEHLNDILSIEEIEYINGIQKSICLWKNVDELKEIQYNTKIDEREELNMYGGLIIYETSNDDFFEMFNIELMSGYEPKDMLLDEDVTYIYLGSAYKEIKVGTMYEYSQGDETYKLEVAGIFEEGQRVAASNETTIRVGETPNLSLKLDNEIVVVNESQFEHNIICGEYFFTLDKDADFEKVVDEITNVLRGYNEVANCTTLQSIFDELDNMNRQFISIIEGLLWVVVVCTVLIASCIMILDIQKNQKMYGIICANGATTRDVALSIIIENGVIMILSVMLAILVTLTQDKYIFGNEIFNNITIYKVILCCLLMLLITSIAPILCIGKMDTKKMIQGDAI